MRKIYSGIFLFLFSFLLSRADAQVVISQVYGGGGNSGATYTNDFIELFNRGTEAVNVTGWSVQYASAAGTSWQVTTLSGTIPAGGYYLVQEGAGTGGTTPLPTPDASGSINMSGTAGKVALVNNNTALTGSCPGAVIDFVGFGTTANCFEGTGPTPAPSNTLAVLRTSNGCTDNNTNALDFATGAPNPRNSASPLQSCAACTAPSDQATALNLTPAITSIDGSFTAAADADGYLVLISTAATLSQTPGNGASFSPGNTLGNATVVAVGNTTSFTASGLNAATTYYITVFAYKNAGPCYNIVTPLAGSVATAANPAPTVSVSAGSNAAEPATNGSFTVTLSAAAPAGGVTITYSLGGTAALNADYTDALNGNLTIAEGQNSGTITLAVTDDVIAEPAKTISITLLTVNNGYVISNAASSIDLTDDDIPAALPLVTSYSQNFNTLASAGTGNIWTDNSTIPGWYATRTTYNAANGSSNAGALYSFGSTGSTERALGSVGSGSTGTIFYGARFKNNTGTTITSLKISYTGEQWRNGGNASAQTVNFTYQSATSVTTLAGGSWTPVSELNFISPVTGTTAATLDGNVIGTNAVLISYTINGLNIPAGDEIMIRWEDADHSGADHGLGIDDFTIEANPSDLTAPGFTTLAPASGSSDVPTNTTLSITFNEQVVKGSGLLQLRKASDNSTVFSIDVTDAAVVLNGNTLSVPVSSLAVNTAFYITADAGLVKDMAGNDFAGITDPGAWAFQTGTIFYSANFNTCTTALTDGFTQYSSTGAITWACTSFGRDPNAPAGTAAFPNAVQINGFSGGTNVPNVDWLISPSFDLSATTYPLLSFWSRTAFNGLPLHLKVSTDYTGGDPANATWTDINGKFPQQASNIWTLSADINLAAFKQSNVHVAFVYTSTDDDGARWTLDDISLINSPVPPAPSLTLGSTDIQFAFVADGSTADKSFGFTGNDLTEGVTLVASSNFLLSKDGGSFSSSISYTQAEANNITLHPLVRFAPNQNNQNFEGTVTVSTGSLSGTINLKGSSINPLTTLEVVNWNVEWFGSAANGPVNDAQQEQNVKAILQNLDADVYGLVEVVDESRLASVVSQLPGYAYVISDFGSHTNPNSSTAGPLSEAQKLAFVYKTSVLSNITAEPLLSAGINTSEDLSNPNYSYWSSGRFPYMMTADVTLNCVTQKVRFVLVHAKANTSPTATSYDRRKNGADALYNLLNTSYSSDNIIVLGDFNDDLDVSITAGFTTTSWNSFVSDPINYSPLTLPLSLAGKKSTASYNDMIDHVVVSNEMQGYYMPATASVLNDVANLITNYANTTSDHYPVFTRYRFANTTAPVVTTCPAVSPLCINESGNYTIPVFTATDDCDMVAYSYVITGATERSGSGNDASGAFQPGSSTITWTATDTWGNAVSCTTQVIVAPRPAVVIPDAFALPSGTTANTVYTGYAPAGSITLTAQATGGTPGYTYQWTGNSSTAASATVSPATATSYTVTVTDANGCQTTASKSIAVKDVRVTGQPGKVVICHKPGTQNSTQQVNQSAVADHLSHGDQLGSCNVVSYPPLAMTIAPNPSFNYFNIALRGGNPNGTINMRVLNILGKVVEQKANLAPGQTVRIGNNYQTGIYIVEISQGNDREYCTLLKIKL